MQRNLNNTKTQKDNKPNTRDLKQLTQQCNEVFDSKLNFSSNRIKQALYQTNKDNNQSEKLNFDNKLKNQYQASIKSRP